MVITLHNQVGAGTSTGNWIPVEALDIPYTIHFMGSGAGDTYQLYVSNEPTQPGDATDRATLGAVINADNTMKVVTEPYRFIKAKKTAGTQSSQAYIFGTAKK